MLTDNVVKQARYSDLIIFLERYYGYTFRRVGNGYRCRQHESLAVKSDRLSWTWFSRGLNGFGAIDFLMKVDRKPFREAVSVILGAVPSSPITPSRLLQITEQLKTLVLPKRNNNPWRLCDYLIRERCIDHEIVFTLIKRALLYENTYGGVTFVGYDENRTARYACWRSTYDNKRGDCAGSDKRYSFNIPSAFSNCVIIAESPIDVMSYASIINAVDNNSGAWLSYNFLSLAGTSKLALDYFLNRQPHVTELVFCLDNDQAGQTAAEQYTREYMECGYLTSIIRPKLKDFNDDLVAFKYNQKQKTEETKDEQNEISAG